MKKITLLFIMIFASLSVFSQSSKWALTVSGGVGGSVNSSYDDYWYDNSWSDDDIYRNSRLSYEANVGVKFYPLKWLYVKTGVGYARYENKYDSFWFDDISITTDWDKKLVLDGFSIPFVAGFTFPNKSKFYPFAEVGFLTFFTFKDDFADKKFYFGTTQKIGGGFKATDKLAFEVALNSNQLYKFKRHRNDHWGDRDRYDSYSSHITFSAGVTVGCSISF